jgi:integrase
MAHSLPSPFPLPQNLQVLMRVEDYYQNDLRWWIRLHGKRGKFHELPLHHVAQEYLDAYIKLAGIADNKKQMLFLTTKGNSRCLTENQMNRTDALLMIKRRARNAGLTDSISCHTFRAHWYYSLFAQRRYN